MLASHSCTFKWHEFAAHDHETYCATIGPKSGQVLATGGDDLHVHLWRIGRPSPLGTLPKLKSAANVMRFDPLEHSLLFGTRNGVVKLFDLQRWQEIRSAPVHRGHITAVNWHPFNTSVVATAGQDCKVKLLDSRTKAEYSVYQGHTKAVELIAFSPDGRWMATAGQDTTVKLWDLTSGNLLTTFDTHSARITSLKFHPNDFFLCSSGLDGNLCLHDLQTFQTQYTFHTNGSHNAAADFVEMIQVTGRNEDTTELISVSDNSLDVLHIPDHGSNELEVLDSAPIQWEGIADTWIGTAKQKTTDTHIPQYRMHMLVAGIHENIVTVWGVDVMRLQPFSKSSFQEPGRTRTYSESSGKSAEDEPNHTIAESKVDVLDQIEQENKDEIIEDRNQNLSQEGKDSENNNSINTHNGQRRQSISSAHKQQNHSNDVDLRLLKQIEKESRSIDSNSVVSNRTIPSNQTNYAQNDARAHETKASYISNQSVSSSPRPSSTSNVFVLRSNPVSQRRWKQRQIIPARREAPVGLNIHKFLPPSASGLGATAVVASLGGKVGAAAVNRREARLRAAAVTRPTVRHPTQQTSQRFGSPSSSASKTNIGNDNPPSRFVSDIANECLAESGSFLKLMKERYENVETLSTEWRQGNLQTVVDTLIADKDHTIASDILRATDLAGSGVSIEMSTKLFKGVLYPMLDRHVSDYQDISLKTCFSLAKSFAPLIQSTLQGGNPSTGVGVDLAAEERYLRCEKALTAIKDIVPTVQTLSTNSEMSSVSKSAKEFLLLVQSQLPQACA